MFTSHQAADLLNVPLNQLISLIQTGDIRGTVAGEELIIRPDELFAYKWKRDRGRSAGLQKISSADP